MTYHGDMPMARTGLHKPLEDAADSILHAQLSKITRNSEKSDVLTPWKEQDRRRRERYTTSGTPDGSLRRGIISRVAVHPDTGLAHLNSMQAQKASKSLGYGPNAWDGE